MAETGAESGASRETQLTASRLIDLAREQGMDLSPDVAEAIRPQVESLLQRLRILAEALPPGAEPPPAGAAQRSA